MGEPRTLHLQAQQARREGRIGDAIALERRAVDGYAAAGDTDRRIHALRHVADLLSESGDAAAAAPLYREALDYYASAGVPLDAANAVRGAACNAERFGDAEAALRLWGEVRQRYAALGIAPGAAEATARLAAISAPAGTSVPRNRARRPRAG